MAEEAKKKLGFGGSPWNISDEQAQKELKKFLTWGWIAAGVALIVFGWIAIASAAFGARCIILSWRKVNASKPNGVWLKVASIALVVVSVLEIVVLNSMRK